MKSASMALLLALAVGLLVAWQRGWRVKVKNGVTFTIGPELSDVWDAIEQAHQDTVGRGAIVTSARDGEHSAGSFHYLGLAVDLRTRDLSAEQIEELAAELRELLGDDFDVVVESNHIHVEFDPQ